jgi:hypothetical protein
MDMFLHLLDLAFTGGCTAIVVLVMARVGLFPSVVLTYYVEEKGKGEE